MKVATLEKFTHTQTQIFKPSPVMRPRKWQWATQVTAYLSNGAIIQYWQVLDKPTQRLTFRNVRTTIAWNYLRKGYENKNYLFSDAVHRDRALSHLDTFPESKTYLFVEGEDIWVTLNGIDTGYLPQRRLPIICDFSVKISYAIGSGLVFDPQAVIRMFSDIDFGSAKSCTVSRETKPIDRTYQ